MKINEKITNAIKNINTGSKSSRMIDHFSGLSPDAKQLFNEIKEEEDDIDSEKLVCTKSDGKTLTLTLFFNTLNLIKIWFKYLLWQDFIRRIKKGSIQDAKATGRSRRVQFKKNYTKQTLEKKH